MTLSTNESHVQSMVRDGKLTPAQGMMMLEFVEEIARARRSPWRRFRRWLTRVFS